MPETDDRDLKALLIPKVMAAKDRFDVHFARDYTPPEASAWLDTENVLPGPLQPYFLRANTGPRWLLGGILSRPFITARQSGGRFSISSIESSNAYGRSALGRWLTYPVDHCLCIMEGLLRIKTQGGGDLGDEEQGWSEIREGQTVVLAAGRAWAMGFASRYVRFISFANGRGVEEIVQMGGGSYEGFVVPEEARGVDEGRVRKVCGELGVKMEEMEE